MCSIMAMLILLSLLVVASAFPTDPVVSKLDEDRFQYVIVGDGIPRLVDLWIKASDLKEIARFNPDVQNSYHLFTRANPNLSQVIVFGETESLTSSNFDASKRTAVVIHGWVNSATSEINTVIVPAFLSAEDLNVIVVDWSGGAMISEYAVAVVNSVTSGESVARFLSWLNEESGASLSSYHIVGHSLGGHQAGVVGRNLGGQVAYVTDPALPGWIINSNRFKADDGIYTEVIHTNVGVSGFLTPLGDVDWYPNGGINMPGCGGQNCDHGRAYFYFAESIATGGFLGTRCTSYLTALTGNCDSTETLNMGGITPKTGQSGAFFVRTNAAPPFSQS